MPKKPAMRQFNLYRTLAAALVLLFVILPGQTRDESSAEQPARAPSLPPGIDDLDICVVDTMDECWMELNNQPGCYLWSLEPHMIISTNWSGECAGGLAEGSGEITWAWGINRGNNTISTGRLQQGRMHGQWVERWADGTVFEGLYVDSMRHGRWVARWVDGTVFEGFYVDGLPHGRWVVRHADGTVEKRPYVDGLPHGQWVVRKTDGTVLTETYLDGKRQ